MMADTDAHSVEKCLSDSTKEIGTGIEKSEQAPECNGVSYVWDGLALRWYNSLDEMLI